MDIDLFRDGGEHFSTFDTHSFMDDCPEDSTSLDGFSTDLYEWDLEVEKELNGDKALLPANGRKIHETMISISCSPPSKEDFHKIMSDWQQFISIDTDVEEFPIENPLIPPEENEDETVQQKNSPLHEMLDLPEPQNFDITSYINEPDLDHPMDLLQRKPKAGVKKIDLKAQKYIVEEDEVDVDVETISECENTPVLEAGNLDDLLQQFEATEIPDLSSSFTDFSLLSNQEKKDFITNATLVDQLDIVNNPIQIKSEITNNNNTHIEQNFQNKDIRLVKKEVIDDMIVLNEQVDANVLPEIGKIKQELLESTKEFNMNKLENSQHVQLEINAAPENHTPTIQLAASVPSSLANTSRSPNPHILLPQPPTDSTTSFTSDSAKNKVILEALPQELIARIKESGKRKTIPVIPPIPNKKRGGPKTQPPQSVHINKISKIVSPEAIQLDHDYCSSLTPYPKHPQKDSGFESAEEDERIIMRNQPMVKNADGKLMVSLLKVNTIRNNDNQKKKLNLEEYKKRREGFLKSNSNSQNNSPLSSTCSSPLPEDENIKRLKHQEKLMKMAKEVLNTPPKSEKKVENNNNTSPPSVNSAPTTPKVEPVSIPSDMEMKTLVSIGVNTDVIRGKNSVAPVEQLEEIKPLLQKASAKINCNSLITSLIENIPKVINNVNHKESEGKGDDNKVNNAIKEHGEDKTIVYLPKNRTSIKTRHMEVQTNITLIQESKHSRYRRRRNSSSSSSCSSRSSRYSRRRKSSDSSFSSRSSRSGSSSSSYSSSRSSRSRSRSISPRSRRKIRSSERERLREVEERRVIYVGRISSSTTRDDLRKRFQKFGPITNVSLHFRDHGDNYGFVTFANKLDAYEAIEHGNDDPYFPKYDLSFGGRRIFCKTTYSDLDNMRDEEYFQPRAAENSFDVLLREAQEKLRKRKA